MTKEELTQEILKVYPNAHFEITNWDGYKTHNITIKCLDCGHE